MYKCLSRLSVRILVTLLLSFPPLAGFAQQASPDLDVPFVPTPMPVVEAMLELGEVGQDDVLYDLGSGDGRIVVQAAKRYGTNGIGVDLNPERIREARARAAAAEVEDKAQFMEADLFEFDFSDATVVTMYLLPSVNLKLRPRILDELQPGTRIVSNSFDMGDWEPDRTRQVGMNTVYMWIVPAKVAGNWQWSVENGESNHDYRVELQQEYQQVGGRAYVDGEPARLEEAYLEGETLRLAIVPPDASEPVRFEGRLQDGRLVGAVTSQQQDVAWHAEPVAADQG